MFQIKINLKKIIIIIQPTAEGNSTYMRQETADTGAGPTHML